MHRLSSAQIGDELHEDLMASLLLHVRYHSRDSISNLSSTSGLPLLQRPSSHEKPPLFHGFDLSHSVSAMVSEASGTEHTPSPGNYYAMHADTPPMRRPFLDFIYRLECDIAEDEVNVGAPHGSGVIRSIAPIVGGKVRGPRIEAEVLKLGGADWAEVFEGTHVSAFSFLATAASGVWNRSLGSVFRCRKWMRGFIRRGSLQRPTLPQTNAWTVYETRCAVHPADERWRAYHG